MKRITDKITHKESICQLYRSLLRKSTKIKTIPPPASLLQKDTTAYINQISYELRLGIIEEFRRNPARPDILAKLLLSGISLDESLDKLLAGGPWEEFLQVIEDGRREKFNAQLRRGSYLLRKEEVTTKESHQIRGRNKRRIAQGLRTNNDDSECTGVDVPEHRLEFIRKSLSASEVHGRDTLRRYLSKLQEKRMIPIPSLLPYTREQLDTNQHTHYHIIDGVSKRAISEAYDKEYIQSIIIPSMEYDINHIHHFKKVEEIVNEKGPYLVRAKFCRAGPVGIPYLMTPYRRKVGRRQVGYLVTRSYLLFRMKRVWEAGTKELSGETLNDDGSYSIPGCRGFWPHESMYPRKYYEDLAWGEATFELFIKMHELEKQGSDEPINLDEFQDWFEFLDISSEKVNSDYSQLVGQIKQVSGNQLETTRTNVQDKMNNLYRTKVESFDKLTKNLSRYSVHKHSEIVSPEITTTFKKRIGNKMKTDEFPRQERIGRGKTLGDFLEEQGFYNYHYGYKFPDRFKF
ncbi:uncharacterized protein SPAPADRAFT_143139 [Spathaspora passalidarum NRRL Y-27907]|uniref:Uncharacterized protein n=1 Tax=Spathaspora passalidarum (strain NRRL Y-27907 / 11-Y1) TaxID=619300 RepID=G3ATW7_SPAPN|nr:uncharacterized protein SPAPADRAFT_143139 [Spathaspora passalidarum NRRL Y-27907]EGW30343.1 hypothetical protein SPAPADRAFT_143139 [Spathaspora passalidarum NRRL Y-27907]